MTERLSFTEEKPKTLAQQIEGDDLSLDEKLDLIDRAMEEANANNRLDGIVVPVDPMDMLQCESCQ